MIVATRSSSSRLPTITTQGIPRRLAYSICFHLSVFGIYLRRNTCGTHLLQQFQRGMLFRFAQIGEHHPGRTAQIGREESEAGHHVVDAVRTERNADTRHVRHSEDARQVVVASAAADRPDGEIERLDFENRSRIIIEPRASEKSSSIGSSTPAGSRTRRSFPSRKCLPVRQPRRQ